MESVLSGLTSHLDKRAVLVILVPAAAFWLGGAIALVTYCTPPWWGWGVASIVWGCNSLLVSLKMILTDLAVWQQIVLFFALTSLSAVVIELFVLDALQLLEGYWPRWLKWTQRKQIQQKQLWEQQARARLESLHDCSDYLSDSERLEQRELENRLNIRASQRRSRPTELGDVLSAAATRPYDKYGLNIDICFPRLWLLMPEHTRTELTNAREALDTGARVWLWGLLFLLWSLIAWWALPVGIIAIWCSYRALVPAARNYSDLLESAFDLHHTALFQALRWPLPPTPREERIAGIGVTQYLVYVERNSVPRFVSADLPELESNSSTGISHAPIEGPEDV